VIEGVGRMEAPIAANVAARVTQVATYGLQIATVFHQYTSTAERIPPGFKGTINTLDATNATLNQILKFLKDEVEAGRNASGRKLFSDEGLIYVQLLATECGKSLFMVERTVVGACMDRKDLKSSYKRMKKGKPAKKIDFTALELENDKTFLEKVENTRWSYASDLMEGYIERLYDLQLHLLLVFQVISVSELSRDL
jgi:hypothetical protein